MENQIINGIAVKYVDTWNPLLQILLEALKNADFWVTYVRHVNHLEIYGIDGHYGPGSNTFDFFKEYNLIITSYGEDINFFLSPKEKNTGLEIEIRGVLIPFITYILSKIRLDKFLNYTFILHEGTKD